MANDMFRMGERTLKYGKNSPLIYYAITQLFQAHLGILSA